MINPVAAQAFTPSLGRKKTKRLFNRNVLLVGLGAITLLTSLTVGISGLSSRHPSFLDRTVSSLGASGSILVLLAGYLLATLFGAATTDIHSPDLRKKFSLSKPNTSTKIVRVATRIPRILLSSAIDLSILPLAGAILLAAPCYHQSNLDSAIVKKDKAPILLIHGSSFNQMEWVVGLLFLRCRAENFGSVFTLDYDGMLSNSGDKGIEDYADNEIRKKVTDIEEKTGQNQVILIGHSLGGLIAGYFAEYTCKKPDWQKPLSVPTVITIDTPWQGTPLLNFYMPEVSKRHSEMSESDPTHIRPRLAEQALLSHKAGSTTYFTATSTNDFIVPGISALLHEDCNRQSVSSLLSHYSIIASPTTWRWIRSALNETYDRINQRVLP